jgi:hypothetical protein
MITNIKDISVKSYKCNKHVKNYLVFKCNLSILAYDEKYFYFSDTTKLREYLSRMPITVRLLSAF